MAGTPCSLSRATSPVEYSPPRRWASTRATSGECWTSRLSASATVAAGPATFAPYDLSAKTLGAAADTARKALGAVVECYFSADGADTAAATTALATAGYSLYQALFKAPAEQQALATEIRKWLDKLRAEGAVETLEVVAEGEIAVPC